MSVFNTFGRWLGFGGSLSEQPGVQTNVPSASLVAGAKNISPDAALQIAAVWACIDRRATTIASLPFFAYERDGNGQKQLARDSGLYALLHDSPNSRMTPFEFWRAMMLNHDLRGNAYARIDRNAKGEAVALWPMPADQVEAVVLDNGSMAYKYQAGNEVWVLPENSVLHLKNLGNGTTGLSKLEYMQATTDESAKAAYQASKTFATSGKPTGVLMVEKLLTEPQREALRNNFSDLESGDSSRLAILEANMKYQQLSLSPEQQQLLESRIFGTEEICRWFDVPPVLIHHANVTAWGSGISQIVDGYHKLSVRPMLVSIEQAVRKRVMTPAQRVRMDAEFSHDALLRGNLAERYASYAQGVQSGVLMPSEARQFENLPFVPGSDVLMAQVNMVPVAQLGQTQGNANASP
jgi:HK97 family phage portal protein